MTNGILFMITARGGSKGVPGKNLKKIGGLSLVGFKAHSALKSKHCQRLIVSTDDPDIRAEAEAHGAEALFIRPGELASDTAASDAVILHAIDYFEKEENHRYDAIMMLEPSSPFARGQDYDAAVNIYRRHGASTVVGMRETEINSIFVGPLGDNGKADRIINKFMDGGDLRRQAMEPEYTMNGALYLVDWETMRKTRSLYGDPDNIYGYMMDKAHSLEVDTPHDLKLAEFLVQEGVVDMADWR